MSSSRPLSIRPAVALFVTAIFLTSFSEPPAASPAKQDVLSANIDGTVSPRDDFFQYANGEWLKRNPIPEDQARWAISSLVSQDIYAQLRRISEEAAAKKSPRGRAEQLIGDVWATGMDTAAINAQGLTPLQRDLERIEQIRSIDDLVDVVATLHRRNMVADNYFVRQRALFDDRVASDDPAAMLMRALGVQPAADAAAARYGGAELRAAEEQRERQRQARIAELRRQFVDGPVL